MAWSRAKKGDRFVKKDKSVLIGIFDPTWANDQKDAGTKYEFKVEYFDPYGTRYDAEVPLVVDFSRAGMERARLPRSKRSGAGNIERNADPTSSTDNSSTGADTEP